MSDTFEAGYRRAIEDIRWLASARDDYDDAGVREHTDTARLVADILASDNDGYGWLPSWRWDEWEDRLQHLSPVSADPVQGDAKLCENSGGADATENHENGSER